MITLLSLLFLAIVIAAVLFFKPKSSRLNKVIWLLLAGGSLSFVGAAVLFPYTIILADDVARLPSYFVWVSIGGAALGFVSVVTALAIAIMSRIKKL